MYWFTDGTFDLKCKFFLSTFLYKLIEFIKLNLITSWDFSTTSKFVLPKKWSKIFDRLSCSWGGFPPAGESASAVRRFLPSATGDNSGVFTPTTTNASPSSRKTSLQISAHNCFVATTRASNNRGEARGRHNWVKTAFKCVLSEPTGWSMH